MNNNHVYRSFRVPVEPDGSLDEKKIAALFADALKNAEPISAEEFAAEQVPPDPVDIDWLPEYLDRVYGWNREGPRP